MARGSGARQRGVTLFNPASTPVVYSREGHQVGGAERVTVDRLDAVGERVVDDGRLVREDEADASGASGTPAAPEVS